VRCRARAPAWRVHVCSGHASLHVITVGTSEVCHPRQGPARGHRWTRCTGAVAHGSYPNRSARVQERACAGARVCRGARVHESSARVRSARVGSHLRRPWTGFSRPLGMWGLLRMCEQKPRHPQYGMCSECVVFWGRVSHVGIAHHTTLVPTDFHGRVMQFSETATPVLGAP